MRNRRASPSCIRYWSKDVSTAQMRSSAVESGVQRSMPMRGIISSRESENNPVSLGNVREFFEDEGIDRSEFEYHKQVNKGHGRLEVREIWTSTQMNEWFEQEWTGIAQVFMIRRCIKEKGQERREIVYGITCVPRKKADAKRILQLKRKHWSIENRLHYRRDVTLGEDASQVRMKGAPEVLAALNGGIVALMDWLGIKNVAK